MSSEVQLNFKEALAQYNAETQIALNEFKKITTEIFPLQTGFAMSVITYPKMPTVEQAINAKDLISALRTSLETERIKVQKVRDAEVNQKINELGAIIGMYDNTGSKSKEAKWIKEAKLHAQLNLTTSTFWRDSYTAISVIQKWIEEKQKAEKETKIKNEEFAHANWCRQYMLKHELGSCAVVNNISNSTAIDIAHAHMKDVYSKENDITGEKCYCSAHDEARHSHFAETYWDGKEVTVYESSETY